MSNKKKTPVPPAEEAPKKDEQAQQPETEAAETKEQPAQAEEPVAEEKKGPSAEELVQAEKDKYLRLMAEYDNYRKRSAKERESIFSDVRADTVTKFLPVYDNLVRALEQSTQDEAYRKGVELIMAQMNEVLSKLGVTEIKAVGEKFDPALHNAVLHDQDETKGESEIVQELQKGFRMGDKVIRFSMVRTVN